MKNKKLVLGILALTIVGIIFISGCAEKIEQPVEMSQVKIDGTNFVRGNETFKFIGANAAPLIWWDDQSIDRSMKTAKESGISVLRIYLPGHLLEGSKGRAWGLAGKDFEKKPIGFYNEYYFKRLDSILDIASKNNVYLIVTLRDYQWWSDPYWNTSAGKNGMFTDPELIEAFKNYITYTLTRKNTINGKIYKDDPTILAWNIINEPPYWESMFEKLKYILRDWFSTITAHIHSLDSNHPVTVGLTLGDLMWDEYGTHYEILNATGIDFFSFHFFPEWRTDNGSLIQPFTLLNFHPNSEVTKRLVSFRTKTFLSFGKPVVLEEFSFPADDRAEFLRVYRDLIDAAFDSGAAGAVFWCWGIPEMEKEPMAHDFTETDLVAMLKEYADKIKK